MKVHEASASAAPISQPATGSRLRSRRRFQNTTADGDIRRRGTPPGLPKFNVRFLPPQTPASWVRGDEEIWMWQERQWARGGDGVGGMGGQ